MRIARAAVAFALVLPAAVANAQDESGPMLRHWAAPAYWSPVHPSPAAESRRTATAERTPLAVTPPAYAFVAISPCRQYDSRNTSSLLQATPRNVTLTGAPCNIPSGVAAVSVNIALFNIVGAGGNGVFNVGIPSGTSQAWLNYAPTVGQVDNAGAVAVDGSGNIAVQVNQGAGSVDFVIDVNGYYTLSGITAASFTGALSGDVTGTQAATVVSSVGGQTAANVAAGAVLANAATSANTAGAIVRRDGSGNINASVVSAAGGYTQPGTGGETLRTVRGIFTGNPVTILAGSGFTVVRNSIGYLTVTFTTPFTSLPAVQLTPINSTGVITLNGESAGSFGINTYNLAGSLVDFGYIGMTATGTP